MKMSHASVLILFLMDIAVSEKSVIGKGMTLLKAKCIRYISNTMKYLKLNNLK